MKREKPKKYKSIVAFEQRNAHHTEHPVAEILKFYYWWLLLASLPADPTGCPCGDTVIIILPETCLNKHVYKHEWKRNLKLPDFIC